jgi:regulatory protein
MFSKIRLTKEQALPKIKQYCAYQERCHKEVKDKLYNFGLYKIEVETLIAQLIEEDYLNEERFAKQFAGGKFRMKGWGRTKIIYELKQKQVSAYCIKLALREIDDTAYELHLKNLATEKWRNFKNESLLSKKAKTYSYLLQKGYEGELLQKVIAEVSSATNTNNN